MEIQEESFINSRRQGMENLEVNRKASEKRDPNCVL